MSEAEDSGNTRSRKKDRFLWLFKKRRPIAESTEGEGQEPGPAVVNSQSVVGPILSTSSGLQHFASDVPLMVVSKSRLHKDKADIFSKSNPNSRLSSGSLIPSNTLCASVETPQPLVLATQPGAAQHATCMNNPPGLITNSRNFVVSGGNFIVSHPLTQVAHDDGVLDTD